MCVCVCVCVCVYKGEYVLENKIYEILFDFQILTLTQSRPENQTFKQKNLSTSEFCPFSKP